MNKKPENKQRKGVRITLCVLYLLQVLMCTWPFVLLQNPETLKVKDESVFSVIYKIFDNIGAIDAAGGFWRYFPYFLIVFIPVTGFLICALDKERNIKNIASIAFSFAAILCILMVVPIPYIQFGGVVQLIVYIIISFLGTAGAVLRLSKDENHS